MKVQDVMVQDVQFCFPDDSLNRAAQIMWDHACGVVPVIDDARRVVGMITDRDVCMAAYTRGLVLGDMRVRESMRANVRTCRPNEAISRAERVMKECGSRRVPVVDELGVLIGILSLDDVARVATEEPAGSNKAVDLVGVAETLAEVSKAWSQRSARDAAMASAGPRGERKLSAGSEEC